MVMVCTSTGSSTSAGPLHAECWAADDVIVDVVDAAVIVPTTSTQPVLPSTLHTARLRVVVVSSSSSSQFYCNDPAAATSFKWDHWDWDYYEEVNHSCYPSKIAYC